MYTDEIIKNTAAVNDLLASYDGGFQLSRPTLTSTYIPNEFIDTTSTLPILYETELPLFSHMRQISEVQTQTCFQKYSKIITKLNQLRDSVSKLNGASDAVNEMAETLRYLVDSSEMLVHILKHPKGDDALPLPHQYHEPFLRMVKYCKDISENGNRDARDSSVNWNEIIPLLRTMVDTFKDIAELIDCRLQEHQIFRSDTMKMLQQLSKLS